MLLATDRHNWALPLSEVVLAVVTLDPDLDKRDFQLTNGLLVRFQLYNSTGLAAARFLAVGLGPQRVRVAG